MHPFRPRLREPAVRSDRRWRAALVLPLALALVLAGCFGSALKRDARRLRRQCDVVEGRPIDERQARCVARIYGIEDRDDCPMEVERPEGWGEPVFRVQESCLRLGVIIAASTGEVLAIVAGDDVLYD